MRGSRYPPAPTKKTSVENALVFCFIRYLKFHSQGWIRTAAATTAACGGNREARLGQRSAFSKPCQGAAEKAASATRKARRIVRRAKKPLRGFFRCAARIIHPRSTKKADGHSKTTLVQTGIRVCAQKPAPGSCCSRPGAGFLCVKDSEKGKGGKREFWFYAAFAGAKTSVFFRRACIERTMQLRVKLMIK